MPHSALLVWAALVSACAPEQEASADRASTGRAEAAADSGFAAVQERGKAAMGVDQYTSTHLFQPLPDGGTIELQRDLADSAGRARILVHLHEISRAFAAGNFSVPGFVHGRAVPGTAVMAAKRTAISYVVESLPRGGALRLETSDSSAVGAIHRFLAFQRMDHRTGSHHEE